MVKIRLSRIGKKHYPTYKIVAVHAQEKRESDFLEILGHYDPQKKVGPKVKLEADRIKYWLSVGAQPTDTVKSFLVKESILPKAKFQKKFQSKPGKKAQARLEAAQK